MSETMKLMGLDTPAKQHAFAALLEAHRRIVEDETAKRAQTLGTRVRRAAPIVGTAAAAGAVASQQGQALAADVGQWAGDGLVSGAEGLVNLGAEGWRNAVEIKDAAVHEAGQLWDSAVQEAGQRWDSAVQGWNNFTDAAGEKIDGAIHGAGEAISTVSGWVTSGLHGANEVGNAIGAWAGQQMDAVAANPESHALVAAAAVGAVVAATPQLREAAGKAANAVNRWAKAGWSATTGAVQAGASAVASLPGRAVEGVKNLAHEVRNDPRLQYVIQQAGWGPKETHAAANEAESITAGENPTLPKTAEVTKALGQDGAQPAAGTKVEQQSTEATTAAAGQSEAAKTTQQKKSGPAQGL